MSQYFVRTQFKKITLNLCAFRSCSVMHNKCSLPCCQCTAKFMLSIGICLCYIHTCVLQCRVVSPYFRTRFISVFMLWLGIQILYHTFTANLLSKLQVFRHRRVIIEPTQNNVELSSLRYYSHLSMFHCLLLDLIVLTSMFNLESSVDYAYFMRKN